MRITWLGHSCFRLEKDGFAVIVDPYADGTVPGLNPIREEADMVICSHEHRDHYGKENVRLLEGKENPFTVTYLGSFHDEEKGAKRGINMLTILDDGENKVAHLGDLGCELNPRQMEQLKGLRVLMIPVGGFYTIDAKTAAKLVEQLQPELVLPMHYRDDKLGFGYDVISPVTDFTKLMGDAIEVAGSSIDVQEMQSAQVVLLRPKNVQG